MPIGRIRLAQLLEEKQRLAATAAIQSAPPQIDAPTALALRRDAEKILSHGTNAEKKHLLRIWVDEIKLAPETLEVEISYKIPEPVVDSMGAGTRFEAFNKLLLGEVAVVTLLYCAGTRNRLPACRGSR